MRDPRKTLEALDERLTEAWPEPIPLDTTPPPVAAFEHDMLPEPLRAWVLDVAERMQCAPDYPAVAAVVALSAAIGRKVPVHPKQRDDWLVVPNLWGAAIGPPSAIKSPAIAEAIKPMRRLQAEAAKAFERAALEHEAAAVVLDAKKKEIEKAIRKAVAKKDGEALAAAQSAYADLRESAPPTPARFIVNDATVEKLGALLNENPNGLLLVRDEMVGWLKTLDREDRANDRAFYLEAFAGTSPYTYDRIGRGTLHIESTAVSIIGTIQPSRLRPYVWQTVHDDGGDGLIQRFQLAVWPDTPDTWRNVDRWPDRDARDGVYALFEAVADMPACTTDERGDLVGVRFSPVAQELFNTWYAGMMRRLREEDLHPAMQTHLGKYPSLVPSLAVVFEVASNGGCRPEAIGEAACRLAIRWAQYLETHAQRIYAGAAQPEAIHADLIWKRRERLPEPFKPRDIRMRKWAGLDSGEAVKAALRVLEDHGLVVADRRGTGPSGGRPSVSYRWNPKAKKCESARATPQQNQQNPSAGGSVGFVGGVGKRFQKNSGPPDAPEPPPMAEHVEAAADLYVSAPRPRDGEIDSRFYRLVADGDMTLEEAQERTRELRAGRRP